MKIRMLEVTGYRSLGKVTWRPGNLNVVTGDGAGELAAAVFQVATAAGGWSAFAEGIREDTPTETLTETLTEMPPEADIVLPPWLLTAGETRWRLVCTPEPDGHLDFTLELVVERQGGGPWAVVHERITRSDDFDEREVLERRDHHARFKRTPRVSRGRPQPPPVEESTTVAGDMTCLGMVPRLRADAQVAPHADAIMQWMRYTPVGTGPGAPARTAPVGTAWQDVLAPDGSNLVGVLYTAWESPSGRARLERGLKSAVPGYESVGFPPEPDGRIGLTVTAHGTTTPLADLPDATVAVLLAFAPLASTQPPALLWFDQPLQGAPAGVLAAFAAVAAEVSAWTQVVVSTVEPLLCEALGAQPAVTVALDTTEGVTALRVVSPGM